MPGQLAINPNKAGCSLRVVIVGGGLAGIALSFTLQRAGHVVTVMERSDGSSRSLTGIRSPPNMTRILNHWGLGPRLAKTAVKCPEFLFHQANGEVLGAIPLHEDFLRDLMADFLFLQHGELKTMLLSLATREGVEFRYNTEVEAVDGDAVSVRLSSGETVYADIVIGADGPDSKVRNLVAGETILGEKDGNMSLTMAIPTDRMRDDEDLRALTQGGKWWVWLGPNLLFHGSLISGGKLFSIVIGLRDVEPEKIAKYEESWENEYDINEFGIDWSAYDIRVQKMMKLVEKVTAIAHVKRPILESCVCDQARIVIVGEAAHPLVPTGQHGTGLVIEDAETMGALFSRIQNRSQIPRMLSAYEELRQTRCNHAQDYEGRKRHMLSAPTGPQQKARDERIRRTAAFQGDWAHLDEARFMAMWGDEIHMFSYSSTESVQDWFSKWGGLALAPKSGKLDPISPTVEVNISSGHPRPTRKLS
ncbi:unnamed protein product [Mycena citricolor]|uniref:FAD-binding domain-containing protein n=1 Tax=Mycena citricolor TaxID=2018698 RepID=A0AAD2HHH4_9AGAR|nr:unnamed protein product [Mycena citricolor]